MSPDPETERLTLLINAKADCKDAVGLISAIADMFLHLEIKHLNALFNKAGVLSKISMFAGIANLIMLPITVHYRLIEIPIVLSILILTISTYFFLTQIRLKRMKKTRQERFMTFMNQTLEALGIEPYTPPSPPRSNGDQCTEIES